MQKKFFHKATQVFSVGEASFGIHFEKATYSWRHQLSCNVIIWKSLLTLSWLHKVTNSFPKNPEHLSKSLVLTTIWRKQNAIIFFQLKLFYVSEQGGNSNLAKLMTSLTLYLLVSKTTLNNLETFDEIKNSSSVVTLILQRALKQVHLGKHAYFDDVSPSWWTWLLWWCH